MGTKIDPRAAILAGAALALALAAACRGTERVAERGAGPTGSVDAAPARAGRPLDRAYEAGEVVRYVMTGVNQSRNSVRRYTAVCEAVVEQDENGAFFEETRWTRLEVDGQEIPLDETSLAFRQRLSLAPRSSMPFPDVRGLHPFLIGPVFDLMTFYVDAHADLHQHRLQRAGDRLHVPHGKPNSWADGVHVLVGQDSIDFDLELVAADQRSAHLHVRHVPPQEPEIDLPAEWMRTHVGEGPNNWVQITRDPSADPPVWTAGVGRETFDVDVHIERPAGRIVSATMDNPVDVVQRRCRDAALTECGESETYRIHRRVELRLRP